MRALFKTCLLAGAAWSVAGAAAAQSAPSDEPSAVEEIVVTARRTEESLSHVPVSVSACNEAALDRIQATDTTGLQGAVPNLNIVQGRGSSNATNIFIRGVGQPDALQTFDPAVGVYVDDVYLSRIRGTQLDLLDLERVEVLRGPQGTLYGKNTIAGALKLVSRKPGEEFRANGSLAVGSYNLIEAKGSVSGPVADGLSLGLSALYSKRDGYVTDPVLNREYNDKNTKAARVALAWKPTDTFRLDVAADYSNDDAALTTGQPLNTVTTIAGVPVVTVPANNPYNFTARTTPGLPNSTKLTHWGVHATATWNLTDALTLKSITAYRDLKTDDYVDIDATQAELGDVFVGVDQNQFSQELQLTYVTDRWNAVGGLYYLKENVGSHQEAYADDYLGTFFGGGTFLRTVDDDLETTSWAAYANASYAFTEKLRLSLGIRYTEEKKNYDRTTSTFSTNPLFVGTFPFNPPTGTWTDVSPMASLDYRFTDDIMGYIRVSKGFKSGGFNGRANTPGETTAYRPETMVSAEVGVKARLFDTVRVSVAGFNNQYKDFQARVSGLDIIAGVPTTVLSVLNAGRMRISGVEFEGSWTPVPGLLLDTQIGYLDAKYSDFDDARFPGGTRTFQTPAFAPDWTARYGAQYSWELAGAGKLTVGAQAKYRGQTALAVDNTFIIGNTGTTTPVPGLFQEGYWLYDARAVWESGDGRYTAGVYGQNLSDEIYKTEGQDFSTLGQVRTVYYGAPQTWMFKVTARY